MHVFFPPVYSWPSAPTYLPRLQGIPTQQHDSRLSLARRLNRGRKRKQNRYCMTKKTSSAARRRQHAAQGCRLQATQRPHTHSEMTSQLDVCQPSPRVTVNRTDLVSGEVQSAPSGHSIVNPLLHRSLRGFARGPSLVPYAPFTYMCKEPIPPPRGFPPVGKGGAPSRSSLGPGSLRWQILSYDWGFSADCLLRGYAAQSITHQVSGQNTLGEGRGVVSQMSVTSLKS